MKWGEIAVALGVLTPLLIGIGAGLRGLVTSLLNRKAKRKAAAAASIREVEDKADAADAAEAKRLADQQARLDIINARTLEDFERRMQEMDARLAAERSARETLEQRLANERSERIRESERFFAILHSLRARDWMWSELYHRMAGQMTANGLQPEPLPDELHVLPRAVEQFFRRSTDVPPGTILDASGQRVYPATPPDQMSTGTDN